MNTSTRRDFLRHGSGAAAATAALTALPLVHSAESEKSEVIRLGIIGCGGMMNGHLQGMIKRKSAVTFAWLCDVDPRQLASTRDRVAGAQSAAPQETSHYEDVIDDSDVDAVIIATPHHWHAPIALAAIGAGKDVYIEKPISHVYSEGPLVRDAARTHGRIVQHGTQMRSSPVTAQAAKLLADGVIGDVKVARAWTAELRSVLSPVPDRDAPEGVDYDRWLGPAPERPFNPHRFHGSWRLFRDYANGEIGDDGIHDLDMARWGLGDPGLPVQVTARGSRMMLHGHVSEYPDNLHVVYEFGDGRMLVYENYPFMEYGMHGFDNGNVFYGTEGYMVFSRRGAFTTYLGKKGKKGPTEDKAIRSEIGYDEHMEDFLHAVRTRQQTAAPAEVAHQSAALVHLGEITAMTTGRLNFDPEREQFAGHDEANQMLDKSYRSPYQLPTA